MPRLFLALPIDPGFLSIPDAVQDMDDGVRWIPSERWHCTLHFAGDVTADEQDAIVSSLDDHLTSPPPIELNGEGYTFFPSRSNPRVLVALLERHAAFVRLHETVQEAMTHAGQEIDRRRFRPHVTIARLKKVGSDAAHMIYRALPSTFKPGCAREMHLYESELGPDGPTYTVRHMWPLTG